MNKLTILSAFVLFHTMTAHNSAAMGPQGARVSRLVDTPYIPYYGEGP